MRPTKATAPHTDTTAATIRVVRLSTRARQRAGSRPKPRAALSPRLSIRMGFRTSHSRAAHPAASRAGRAIFGAVTAERLPMVQLSMAPSWPSGSANVLSAISPASASDETMTPASR